MHTLFNPLKKGIKLRIFFIVALLVGCLGISSPRISSIETQEVPSRRVAVPFTMPQNHSVPMIKVKYGDGSEGLFLLDTGTNTTLISPKVAARMKLPRKPHLGVDGKPILFFGKPAEVVRIPQINIANSVMNDVPFVVLPEKSILSAFHEPIDGLLSANFFAVYGILIDYPGRTITLWPGGKVTDAELKEVGLTNAHVLPIRLDDGRNMVAKVRYNGGLEDDVAIDTGTMQTKVSVINSQKLKLQPTIKGMKYTVFVGESLMDMSLVDEIKAGDLNFGSVPVVYAEDPKQEYVPCIGLDLLKPYRMLFDLPANKLYLQRDKVWIHPNLIKPDPTTLSKRFLWQRKFVPASTMRSVQTREIEICIDNVPNVIIASTLYYFERINSIDASGKATIQSVSTPDPSGTAKELFALTPEQLSRRINKITSNGMLVEVSDLPNTGQQDGTLILTRLVTSKPVPPKLTAQGETWEMMMANPFVKDKLISITSTLISVQEKEGKQIAWVSKHISLPGTENDKGIATIQETYSVEIRTGIILTEDTVIENYPDVINGVKSRIFIVSHTECKI